MNNQECKIRLEIMDINSNEPLFYPYIVKISKCSGSCNNVKDPYAKSCVPDVVKKLNVKVFNLMSRTNDTRHIKWHETCKCKCRLGAIVCNNEQRWNKNKCRCECKELIDKGIWDKEFIWNLSNCDCECDKLCDVGECYDYKNCKCTNKLVGKLIEEYGENIDWNEMIYNKILNGFGNVWSSCTVYFVSLVIFFIICISISSAFIYFHWLSKKDILKQQFI